MILHSYQTNPVRFRRVTNQLLLLSCWFLLCLTFTLSAFSQTTNSPPQPQDPLMSLLLSQPKIEISGPIRVTAAFDPPVAAVGKRSVYRVTFNALEDSVDWPDDFKGPADLALQPGGRGQILQMTGPNMEPRTAFLYHTRPSKIGEFTIPEFTLKVYGKPVKVPEA